jgi:high-affinity K+ transport system ATPase subunit B
MGIRQQLEAMILAEAREVTKNKKLRQKDILAWTTGELVPMDGETVVELPGVGVRIAFKTLPVVS